MAVHPSLLDRRLSDLDAQNLQLAVNLRCNPATVVPGHALSEFTEVEACENSEDGPIASLNFT